VARPFDLYIWYFPDESSPFSAPFRCYKPVLRLQRNRRQYCLLRSYRWRCNRLSLPQVWLAHHDSPGKLLEENNQLLKAIYEENSKYQKKTVYLWEKIAQKYGSLGQENESKIKGEVIKKGAMTKQEVIKLVNASNTGALNIMKRMGSESSMFRYIAGSGNRQSRLIYIEEGSLESKAIQLSEIMPRGSSLSLEEAREKLELEDDEVRKVVEIAESMFGKEFFWSSKSIVRRR